MNLFNKVFGSGTEEPQSVEDQSVDEKALVEFMRHRVEDSRSSAQRVSWESTFLTNVAYVLGFDSVYYDSKTRSYRPMAGTSSNITRSQLRSNKILPTLQNRTSKLCKQVPKYEVRPNSSSNEDKDAARLGFHIINDIWDKEKINQKRIQLTMMLQEAGWAFIKVCWDDIKGKYIQTEDGEGLFEGDVSVEVINPLEIFVDPMAKSLEEATWVCQCKIRKLDYFRERYPRGALVKQEGAWLQSLDYEMRLNNLGPSGPSATTTDQQMKNAAIEICYYERPTLKHPHGRQIISANGVLLEDKELPIGEIPFAKFDDVVIGGRFAAEAIATHLRPLQDQHTRLIRKRAQWTNRLLAGKYIAPKGHGLSQESLNDQSGEVLEYNPGPRGEKPEQMQVPMIPSYAYTEEESLDKNFDDVSGINEISRGQMPSAGIPAQGMEILIEQDSSRIAIMTEQHEHAYSDVGRFILKYVAAYYKTPRMLKLAGKGYEYTVKPFTGKDLMDNFDVKVIRSSLIPNSKVLKRQEILNAYQQGLLGDPLDPKLREKVLSMLEYGDVAEMWQDLATDMAQAKRFIDEIEQEQIPVISEFDNHQTLFQELNRYRKSDKYFSISLISQGILEETLEHLLDQGVKVQSPGLQNERAMAENLVNETEGQSQEIQQSMAPELNEQAVPESVAAV